MGSSQRKKKEKKKDFQKAKLKVGKSKPKAANITDTSFRSKSIVLNQQSLATAAPSSSSQFSHHVSLLTSKSDTQRRDSLSYLITAVSSRPARSSMPQPVSILLPKLLPLILDGSSGVRTQLQKLFRVLPTQEVENHAADLLPYLRAGMTHLSTDIRSSTVEILSWLLEVAGSEAVSCPGGWVKTLNCFLSVLGWHPKTSGKWSANKPSMNRAGTEAKTIARALQVLTQFLTSGMVQPAEAAVTIIGEGEEELGFPLWNTDQHFLPKKTNPFGYLNLFGAPMDEEDAMLDDREDRVRVFDKGYRQPIERGLDDCRKEGGEVGRAAVVVSRILNDSRGETNFD